MATDVVKQIRRRTRRKFSADEKIRIVLERLGDLEDLSAPVHEGVTHAFIGFVRSPSTLQSCLDQEDGNNSQIRFRRGIRG